MLFDILGEASKSSINVEFTASNNLEFKGCAMVLRNNNVLFLNKYISEDEQSDTLEIAKQFFEKGNGDFLKIKGKPSSIFLKSNIEHTF